jgi:hypothetical protein
MSVNSTFRTVFAQKGSADSINITDFISKGSLISVETVIKGTTLRNRISLIEVFENLFRNSSTILIEFRSNIFERKTITETVFDNNSIKIR